MSELLPLPQEAPHFFTGVVFDLVPGIDYAALEEVSQLAKHNARAALYRGVRDALQKLQWARIAAMQAVAIDERLITEYRPGIVALDLAGQVQHAKAMFELVAHIKSALANIAVCLNEVLALDIPGGDRDFKWSRFRARVLQQDQALGEVLRILSPWLDKNISNIESISAVRDYWIHTGAPVVPQLWPPTELGALPIPKAIPATLLTPGAGTLSDHYWRTDAFAEFHLARLDQVFNAVIRACISKERSIGSTLEVVHTAGKMNFLPMLVTEQSTVDTMRLIAEGRS